MIGETLAGAGAAVWAYAYVGYPAVLRLLARGRPAPPRGATPADWPRLTITIPVYNGAATLARTLESVLASRYPADRLAVVVLSDGSTDATDAIARRYGPRGVTLVRLPQRAGKTAAENAAAPWLTGPIAVNVDAAVTLHPDALARLAAAFDDPTVGVASAVDVSVAADRGDAAGGEGTYVGYEMKIRELETRVAGIVGASGCCFAMRSRLRARQVPPALSWDFAAPLIAREAGYRSVSVPDARCEVPAGGSLAREYRRKVRTMARGLATLAYYRRLLDPFRYGVFAWMLASHKLARWLAPWGAVLIVAGAALAAPRHPWWWAVPAAVGGALGLGVVALRDPERRLPRPLAALAYLALGVLAAGEAWLVALRGGAAAVWEPTRRVEGPAAPATTRRATPASRGPSAA